MDTTSVGVRRDPRPLLSALRRPVPGRPGAKGRGRGGGTVSTNKVLWVKGRDGVCCRKEAGRIPAELWETSCGGPMRIVFGQITAH